MTSYLRTILISVFLGFCLSMTAGFAVGCKGSDTRQQSPIIEKSAKMMEKKERKNKKNRKNKEKEIKKEKQPRWSKQPPLPELNEEQQREMERRLTQKLQTVLNENNAERYILSLEKKVKTQLEKENAQ